MYLPLEYYLPYLPTTILAIFSSFCFRFLFFFLVSLLYLRYLPTYLHVPTLFFY